ncbi:hypothetical protein AFL01nite_07850 [Aeromicrobium flavum]|uniref:Uncharacterized protein n=1 Tax=Aeromicrobium flavum TaxID=416568 RepID=A0A512HSL9_9ACTN|nr:hypothetical protein [Aeromicrobium flavum]GEO88458.1 hypothetical protein AFL01nite_07850 [Aeromicrobium flavum]
MSHGRPDLRLDAPVLEPSEDLVQRLAATARSSRVPHLAHRHRLAVVAASFLGVSAISVGGAWAVGAIDVPGVPSSPLKQEATLPPPAPDRSGGDSGADSGTGPAAQLPPRWNDPSPAPPDDPVDESPAEPREQDAPGRGSRDAAPKESNPGQGETRREDKGDNGKRKGQDRDDPPGQGQGRGNQDGNGRAQEKPDREAGDAGRSAEARQERERGDQGG